VWHYMFTDVLECWSSYVTERRECLSDPQVPELMQDLRNLQVDTCFISWMHQAYLLNNQAHIKLLVGLLFLYEFIVHQSDTRPEIANNEIYGMVKETVIGIHSSCAAIVIFPDVLKLKLERLSYYFVNVSWRGTWSSVKELVQYRKNKNQYR